MRADGGSALSGDEIRREFDGAAPHYDLMVALNPGYHRHLSRAARTLTDRQPGERLRLLDLGCGSGASTVALVRAAGSRLASVLGVDASAGMLARAEAKRWPVGISFRQARAEDLRNSVEAASVDGVFAAYLFRNIADPERDAAVRTTFELLRPGGTLVVQEYSVGTRRTAIAVWTAVCWLVVIPLSVVTSRRTRLYRYLWRSVLDFDSAERFVRRLTDAGFVDVRVTTASGWQRGILHTFSAGTPS